VAELNVPPAPPSLQFQANPPWPLLSVPVARSATAPPEATVLGVAVAVTVTVWVPTRCTVRVVEPLALLGPAPLQVAVRVRVTVRLAVPLFTAAMYVGLCAAADGLNVPLAPPSDQDHKAMPWPELSTAEPLRALLPPEARVVGLHAAVTATVWLVAAGCTVRVVEPLALIAPAPLQVAVQVRITARFEPLVLAAAV